MLLLLLLKIILKWWTSLFNIYLENWKQKTAIVYLLCWLIHVITYIEIKCVCVCVVDLINSREEKTFQTISLAIVLLYAHCSSVFMYIFFSQYNFVWILTWNYICLMLKWMQNLTKKKKEIWIIYWAKSKRFWLLFIHLVS